ncbi:MAG: hypothetical protein R3236_01280 [Phycisphaeraceae bacterium]|nr:hypothetical protein [Phycisphaeraceae bacterium]
MSQRNPLTFTICLTGVLSLLIGCSSYRKSHTEDPEAQRAELKESAQSALASFRQKNPKLESFIDESHGYAVFPSVNKGAIGIGGAHGEGVVYQGGDVIGYAELSQGTIGVQLGAQTYSEFIFFEDKGALERFKNSDVKFSGQASAAGGAAGDAVNADYEEGVAVFTMALGGLMFEASIGGQEFDYQDAEHAP